MEGSLVINDSPIEYVSSLLVPKLEDKLPQVLTEDAIFFALLFISNSKNSCLRLGFNSLGAAASVNHLHWHVYHFEHELAVEEAEIDENNFLLNWPVNGFAWDLTDWSQFSFKKLAENVMSIIDKCYSNGLAYNCFLTKKRNSNSTIRFILWPRLPCFGSKNDMGIIAAFCEFSGFFICKTRESFDCIDERDCIQVISAVSVPIEKLSLLLN